MNVIHTAGTPATTATTATTATGFTRFIDEVKAFFVQAEPVAEAVEGIAVLAEPVLALTPVGPEYTIAVNAVVGAQRAAQALIASGVNLTGTQKAAIAVQTATPALNTILTSKGITSDTEAIIGNWIQTIFNILAGPIANLVTRSAAPASATQVATGATS